MSNQREHVSLESAMERGYMWLRSGNLKAATDVFAQILRQAPQANEARRELRSCLGTLAIPDPNAYAERLAESIVNGIDYFDAAVPGWLFARHVDTAYLTDGADISRVAPRRTPQTSKQVWDTSIHAQDILYDLSTKATARATWEALKRLTQSATQPTTADSFCGCDHVQLRQAITDAFSRNTVNIVIVGAGCAGLMLANALKMVLGHRVEILITETRVQRPRVKLPYARNWLMEIPLEYFESIFDDVLTGIFRRTSAGRMTAISLAMFETLLLLSNKTRGVRFLFDHDVDYSFIDDSPVHLVFDASGGRLYPPGDSSNEQLPSVRTNATMNGFHRSSDFLNQFSINQHVDLEKADIEIGQYGDTLRPLFNGQPIRQPMFKVTGAPLELYEPLMGALFSSNKDARFYLWRGVLHPSINELLIVTSLTADEYMNLADAIAHPVLVREVTQKAELMETLDPRIRGMLSLVETHPRGDSARIEPPFVFAPYLRPYPSPLDTLHGRPVIPIGDSLFVGNLKTGNGLTQHVLNTRRMHDAALLNLGAQT